MYIFGTTVFTTSEQQGMVMGKLTAKGFLEGSQGTSDSFHTAGVGVLSVILQDQRG